MPIMHKALGLIPRTSRKEERKEIKIIKVKLFLPEVVWAGHWTPRYNPVLDSCSPASAVFLSTLPPKVGEVSVLSGFQWHWHPVLPAGVLAFFQHQVSPWEAWSWVSSLKPGFILSSLPRSRCFSPQECLVWSLFSSYLLLTLLF